MLVSVWDYVNQTLPAGERGLVEEHLNACSKCRAACASLRDVRHVLAESMVPNRLCAGFTEKLEQRLATKAHIPASSPLNEVLSESFLKDGDLQQRLGAMTWWGVSALLHVLVIILLGLISMAVALPGQDNSIIIMVTEMQPQIEIKSEELEAPKEKSESALVTKHDTPPTDPSSKEASDVIVPPDILKMAELRDHFETVNLDRPDTQSAFGTPDAKMFHSIEGNDEPAGGGGVGSAGLDNLIGIGGAASIGTGGGWGGGQGTGIGIHSGSGSGSFGSRNGGGRRFMVKKHGGSRATENAVDLALQWLAYHQEADGHWDTKKYQSEFKTDTAVSALALLAFLGAGHTEKVGIYQNNVRRAVDWFKSIQGANGCLFGDGCNIHPPHPKELGYGAAIATLALAEAAGMGNIADTRAAAQRAINYCTEIHQEGKDSERGAWRYAPKTPGDLSVTGWYIMALKSAKVAGLIVDPASFEGASLFLDSVEKKEKDGDYGPVSHYIYMKSNRYPTKESIYRMAAIGCLGRQFMGCQKERIQGSVEWFMEKGGVPEWGQNGDKVDLYYWYYGTLSVFQQGGDLWKRWNEALKGALVEHQCPKGDDTGSWEPTGSWKQYWGRAGQTALSALCLEVYYRYLQLTPDHTE